jgi:hypothetical protein
MNPIARLPGGRRDAMTGRSRMPRWIGFGFLAIWSVAAAVAQHPYLGPNHPAPDPRIAGERDLQTSASRAMEAGEWQGLESCAFRARGLPHTQTRYYVDAWALGVERWERDQAILFFETRVVDSAGAPLAIERPTLYLIQFGPTSDWRPGRPSADGYVRIEKELSATGPDERLGFRSAIEDRVMRELAFTLPGGTGDAYVSLHDGATPLQHNLFADCVCRLLGKDSGLYRCP